MGLNSKCNREKWELIAKEQGGSLWTENREEVA